MNIYCYIDLLSILENVLLAYDLDLKFTLLTNDSIDRDPPLFTFSIDVSNYPPSMVTCSVNGGDNLDDVQFEGDVITATDPVSVSVTVTIGARLAGSYVCGVSAKGPDTLDQPAGGATQYTSGFTITGGNIIQ